MDHRENNISKYDVLKAIEYSLIKGNIDPSRLEYYRLNLACDARYTFKIVNLLKQCEILYIEYRGKKFIYKDKQIYQI